MRKKKKEEEEEEKLSKQRQTVRHTDRCWRASPLYAPLPGHFLFQASSHFSKGVSNIYIPTHSPVEHLDGLACIVELPVGAHLVGIFAAHRDDLPIVNMYLALKEGF